MNTPDLSVRPAIASTPGRIEGIIEHGGRFTLIVSVGDGQITWSADRLTPWMVVGAPIVLILASEIGK